MPRISFTDLLRGVLSSAGTVARTIAPPPPTTYAEFFLSELSEQKSRLIKLTMNSFLWEGFVRWSFWPPIAGAGLTNGIFE